MALKHIEDPVRVGEPESLVKPGDPVPGKPGHYYEAGQYAPSPERLSAMKINESVRAGLLATVREDKELSKLFSKNGEVLLDKLKKFDPSPWFRAYGFTSVDKNLPVFASIGLISNLLVINPSHTKYAKFTAVEWVADTSVNKEENLQEQMELIYDSVDLTVKNRVVGIRKNKETREKTLVVFQPYFVFMSVPIIPGVAGVSTGLSIASAATIKAIGRGIFYELTVKQKGLFKKFLDIAGWKKASELIPGEDQTYIRGGREIGLDRKTIWFRNYTVPPVSSNFVISPYESFAESYMYYWFHRVYLEKVNPKIVSFMDELNEYLSETTEATAKQ